MNLKEWLRVNGISITTFAEEKLEVSRPTLSKYIHGKIKIPLVTRLAIEHLTAGAVRVEDWKN
jgi:DNA-binding transcriptional regulator YdaS (Cro superfamily)